MPPSADPPVRVQIETEDGGMFILTEHEPVGADAECSTGSLRACSVQVGQAAWLGGERRQVKSIGFAPPEAPKVEL